MLWPLLVGMARARDILLRGVPIDAAEALHLRLVTEIVAPDQLLNVALRTASELGELPHLAYAATKLSLNRCWQLSSMVSWDQALAYEAAALVERHQRQSRQDQECSIMTDVLAAAAGSVGLAARANVGDATAYFEPIHGTAPGKTGKGTVNPVSQIQAAALLLAWLGRQYSDSAATLALHGSATRSHMSSTAATCCPLISAALHRQRTWWKQCAANCIAPLV